jgi:hypothetical protein
MDKYQWLLDNAAKWSWNPSNAYKNISGFAHKGTGYAGYALDEAVCLAMDKDAAQPVQEPVAWAVQGCSKMWRGEFAEIDAKAEAKRIGGTCVAYALYTTPPAAQPDHIVDPNKMVQPVQQPVAWVVEFENGEQELHFEEPSVGETITPLYTTPPQRPWVGLTQDQFSKAIRLAEDGEYLVALELIQQCLRRANT